MRDDWVPTPDFPSLYSPWMEMFIGCQAYWILLTNQTQNELHIIKQCGWWDVLQVWAFTDRLVHIKKKIAIHSARECWRCKLIDCVRLLWLISMTTAERPKMTSGLPKFIFEENGLKSSSVRKRKILAHLKFYWIAWPLSIVKLSKLNQRATWTFKTWQRL